MKRRFLLTFALLVLLVGVPGAFLAWSFMVAKQADAARSGGQTLFAPLLTATSWGARRLSESLEFVVASGDVRRRNHLLEEKLARLETENRFLRESLAKYSRMDASAALAAASGLEYIEAEVMAYGRRPWARSLLINAGSRGGVRRGDPALHRGGLAGTVLTPGPWTSTVQLLNDPQSAVGVLVLPMRARGVVKGSGDPDLLEIILEESIVGLRKGQQVITSGMVGSLYPRGIPVGTIGDLKLNRFGQVIADVVPAVRFDQIEEVLVLRARRNLVAPANGEEEAIDGKR